MSSQASKAEEVAKLCISCPRKYEVKATHIAHAQKTDGGSVEWPVCREHMQMAMCAGWFPIDEIREDPSNGL